jgi:hypothetical protein
MRATAVSDRFGPSIPRIVNVPNRVGSWALAATRAFRAGFLALMESRHYNRLAGMLRPHRSWGALHPCLVWLT